jgi:hypothetical protein
MQAAIRVSAAIVAAIAVLGAAGAGAHPFSSVALGDGAKLASYKSVHVAPVSANLPDGARYGRSGGERPVDPADAADKAGDLQRKLSEALGRTLALADGPGPGVLSVAATLTRLQSSRPTRADYRVQPSLDFRSVYAGGAAARFEFSEDGKALGSMTGDFDTSLADGWPRAGVWDDADRAFSSWARALPDFIAGR